VFNSPRERTQFKRKKNPGRTRTRERPADLFERFETIPTKAVQNTQKLPGKTKENGWKRNRNSP
jgi:hypothetical protein